MTFLDFAEKVLNLERKPLSQKDIWDIGEKKGFSTDLNTKGLTPWQTLGSALRRDIRDNQNTIFYIIDGSNPFEYYIKTLSQSVALPVIKPQKKVKDNNKFLEKELHRYLSYFVYEKDKIYTKTINAQKSTKWLNSIWRHPDIVGISFPIWESDILDLSKDVESYGLKFYSYELKREINASNLREHYFEAVSNSSWANEGYLVAAEISEDPDFLEEIKRLNNAFGIGLIHISMDDPSNNVILLQAKYNKNIDIESINILSRINEGFKVFLKDVKADFNSTRGIKGIYDERLKVEELYKKQ
jgi:hypothetical protein